MNKTKLLSVCVGVLMLTAPAVRADEHPLVYATPADSLAALYLARCESAEEDHSAIGLVLSVLLGGEEFGLMSGIGPKGRMWLEALHSWPLLRRYPRAYVLYDISFTSSGASNHLEKLKMSLILDTRNEHTLVEQRIQYLLNQFTSKQTSRLEVLEHSGLSFQRLSDQRLPGWCVFEWGAANDLYVLGIGSGSFAAIVDTIQQRAPALDSDEWFTVARNEVGCPTTLLSVVAAPAAINSGLGEGAEKRFRSVLSALGLGSTDRLMLCVGRDGRAVVSRVYLQEQQVNRVVQLASVLSEDSPRRLFIPAQATWYVHLSHAPAVVWDRIKSAYLALLRPEKAGRIREIFRQLEQESGTRFHKQILGQLGDHVLVHNYPLHPLRLPMMFTILVDVGDNPQVLNLALNRLLERCAIRLQIAAESSSAPLVVPGLFQAPDGVWYLRAGLYGPALAVTGDYVVISYSPPALRANFAAPEQPTAPVESSAGMPKPPGS